MKRVMICVGMAAVGLSLGAPLAVAKHFSGNFGWIKLSALPQSSIKSLAGAKSLNLQVTFFAPAKVKKDAKGNAWFTFIVADQGNDWKWHQTSGSAAVPVANGVVKPGRYILKLPVTGIPATVLKDKQQTINIGPAASGLDGTTSFAVTGLTGS